MPIYEYKCVDCGNTHDDVRKLEESRVPATCPECGASCEPIMSVVSRPPRARRASSPRLLGEGAAARAPRRPRAGIRFENAGRNNQIQRCLIRGYEVGIEADAHSEVRVVDTRFENVKVPFKRS